jgi:galactokinase
MDQTVAALGREGHLLLLDCGSGRLEWVEFADPAVAVLIVDTRVRHSLASGEYAQRRAQCEAAAAQLAVSQLCESTLERLEAARDAFEPTLYRRARHVLSEQQRTRDAVAAIRRRDWETLGRAMYASHLSLRDDFEVSCAELDAVVDAACAIGLAGGVYGCRMTGGGFGGCAVAVVDAVRAQAIAADIVDAVRRTGVREPRSFVTRAAPCATLQDLQQS